MPVWALRKTAEITYDLEFGELRTSTGVFIALLEINPDGSLAILPGVDTFFTTTSGEQCFGWDGSDENFYCLTYASEEGGSITYQENRKGENPGEKIVIEIVNLEDDWLLITRKASCFSQTEPFLISDKQESAEAKKEESEDPEDFPDQIKDLLGF